MVNRIIIVVENGAVTSCYSNDSELDVIVCDLDNGDDEEETKEDHPDCVHEVHG